jgi:hypothetical protein
MTTFPAMEKATQYELHLAERMSRLGTETAFEVLNKARALERQGKSIITWKLASPISIRLRTSSKPASKP